MRSVRRFSGLLCLFMLVVLLPLPAAAEDEVPRDDPGALLDLARQAFAESEWSRAGVLYEALLEDNPYQGRFWYRFAGTHYQSRNWESCAAAYARAAELGFQRGFSLYNRACCLALDGRDAEAITALEGAIHSGLRDRENLLRTDSDLDRLRDSKAFRARILPAVDAESSRVDGWRTDLAYLDRRMRETHYDLFRNIAEDDWKATLNDLDRRVAELEDHEVVVELMRLVTRIGDGHTTVRTPGTWRGLPLEFYVFEDGLFVRAAASEYADLVGRRVLRIGKLPADAALARVREVTQRDNEMQIRSLAPFRLRTVEVLNGLGIVDGLDAVDVTVEGPDGRPHVMRVAAGARRGRRAAFDVTMVDGTANPTPLWRKKPGRNYWYEHFADDRLVYFKFNAVQNAGGGPSLATFADELFTLIDERGVETLVIDVRNNGGGNNFLVKPIIDSVLRSNRINRRGQLYVIIGRETFSACQNFVNRLEREANPIFVGEPTGSSPNFVGEGNPIQLPWSGLTVNGSSRLWLDSVSDDYRTWIAPDIVAEMTSTDYRTNRDPAMLAVRRYLEQQRTRSAARTD